MRRRVLIVGSAPDANIRPCENIYFANFSALAFENHEWRTVGAKTHCVMSASAIFPLRANKDKEKSLQSENLIIRNSQLHLDETIVFATQDKDMPKPFQIAQTDCFLTPEAYTSLLAQVVGDVPPFVNRQHFMRGLGRRPGKALRLLMQMHRNPSSPPYFRPSTGIVALALAIQRHGPDASYSLSGFSFRNRVAHRIHRHVASADDWYAAHVQADAICLSTLKRHYSVEWFGTS